MGQKKNNIISRQLFFRLEVDIICDFSYSIACNFFHNVAKLFPETVQSHLWEDFMKSSRFFCADTFRGKNQILLAIMYVSKDTDNISVC